MSTERAVAVLTGPLTLGMMGAVAMLMMLGHALGTGDFSSGRAALLENPWGQAAVLDAYVGLVLFSGWIVRREVRRPLALAWVAAALMLGHVVVCAYVARAAWRADGSWPRFWMGARCGEK